MGLYRPVILVMSAEAADLLAEHAAPIREAMADDPRIANLCTENGWSLDMLAQGGWVSSVIGS